MKKSFDEQRITYKKININKKDTFDLTIIKPLNINIDNKVVIYIPGLNGNSSLVKYFNYDFFNDYYLISYDQRAQANNMNKPSRNFKKYLKDLNEIILKVKEYIPNIKKLYIMGESWGSTLSFLFSKYYKNIVDGVIGWNMPYKVVDVATTKGFEKFKNSLKVIITFLFNINTYDYSNFNNNLTNNPMLIRMIKLVKNKRLSNRVILAAWRSFKKSWKYLFKNYDKFNFLYVQSTDDILRTDEIVNKLKKLTNKIKIINGGYHILTFDTEHSDELFRNIDDFIHNK